MKAVWKGCGTFRLTNLSKLTKYNQFVLDWTCHRIGCAFMSNIYKGLNLGLKVSGLFSDIKKASDILVGKLESAGIQGGGVLFSVVSYK